MAKARTVAFVLALAVAVLFAAGLGHWRSHLYMLVRPDAFVTSTSPPYDRDQTPIGSTATNPSPATRSVAAVPAASRPTAAAATSVTQGEGAHLADLGPEPPSAPDPEPAASEAAAPHFDVVRVEPSGDTLVAGKARPNSTVELVDGGHVVGKTTADDAGDFVLLPAPLKPGNYDLSLRAQTDGKTVAHSRQTVAVSVPRAKSGGVVVALAEPGKPSRILTDPSRAAPAAPPAKVRQAEAAQPAGGPQQSVARAQTERVAPRQTAQQQTASQQASSRKTAAASPATAAPAIASVELENRSGVHVSGEAKPGARTEVYLNDSHLASVTPDAGGHWSVTVRKGLTGGHYAVRADVLGTEGKVAARVEVPFDVPKAAEGPGDSPSTAAPAPGGKTVTADSLPAVPSASSAGDAIVDAVETALVVRGDNLWDISRSRLGAGQRYTRIYASNVSQIRDPKLIYPGQVFVVPGD